MRIVRSVPRDFKIVKINLHKKSVSHACENLSLRKRDEDVLTNDFGFF